MSEQSALNFDPQGLPGPKSASLCRFHWTPPFPFSRNVVVGAWRTAPVEGVVIQRKFAVVVVLAVIAAAGCAKRPQTVP